MASVEVRDMFGEDFDACKKSELDEIFPVKYRAKSNVVILERDSKGDSCFMITCNATEKQVAVATTKGSIITVDTGSGRKKNVINVHSSDITSVRFGPNSESIFSSSLDRTIKCVDVRTGNVVQSFEHKDESDTAKPFTCLDVNCSGDYLSAGTNLIGTDVYLLFWDLRQTKHIGGYWECHSSDITQVKFHPSKKEKLASASMDGLINLYDISKKCEDDAFVDCISYGNTADLLSWDPHPDHKEKIFAVTYPQDVLYWEFSCTRPTSHLNAERCCKAISRSVASQCHFVSLNYDQDDTPLLTFSSNSDIDGARSVCVRTVSFDRHLKDLQPHSEMDLSCCSRSKFIENVFLPNNEVFVSLHDDMLYFWSESALKRAVNESVNQSLTKKLRM